MICALESKYIMCHDHTWQVLLSIDDRTLKDIKKGIVNKDFFTDGKGYVFPDGYVWIFQKNKPDHQANRFPYFWWESDTSIGRSNPGDETLQLFVESNIIDTSFNEIVKTTSPDDVLYDERALNDMNSSTKLFRPVIKDTDDFLKKLVKSVIIEKEIDITRLKSRMTKVYSLPNMVAALKGTTKMSVSYFMNWMEILGCDFQVMILDNGSDQTDPLKDDLLFDSTNGNVINYPKE